MPGITKYAERYLQELRDDPFDGRHAFASCYAAFDDCTDDGRLALVLGHYLANFGMMRSSSMLAGRDVSIHIGVLKIIRDAAPELRGRFLVEEMIKPLRALCTELGAYYQGHGISPTDTLITKIVMGALGVLPALDRLVVTATRHDNLFTPLLSVGGLRSLAKYAEANAPEIMQLADRHEIPPMRILDMFLVVRGAEIEQAKLSGR